MLQTVAECEPVEEDSDLGTYQRNSGDCDTVPYHTLARQGKMRRVLARPAKSATEQTETST